MQTRSPIKSRPLAAAAAVGQVLLLLALVWLSADHEAHHKLHHLADALCKICGVQEEAEAACGNHSAEAGSHSHSHSHSHPHGDSHSEAPSEGDENCAVTLFAQGHAQAAPAPMLVVVPVPRILFFNGAPVLPVLPPLPRLLPFSCGPPVCLA